MASILFNAMIRAALTGGINFATDSFKMMLLTVVPGETEKDGWDFRADVTNEVANGNGYATGGKACVLTVAAVDDANNDVEITIDPVAWAASTISADAALVYKDTGNAATDRLVGTIDFGGTVNSTNDAFTVTPTGSIKIQN